MQQYNLSFWRHVSGHLSIAWIILMSEAEVSYECFFGCSSIMWYLNLHSQELDGIICNKVSPANRSWGSISLPVDPCKAMQWHLQTLALIPDHCTSTLQGNGAFCLPQPGLWPACNTAQDNLSAWRRYHSGFGRYTF